MLEILDYTFAELGRGFWHVKMGGLEEVRPRTDLLTPFGYPFSKSSIVLIIKFHSHDYVQSGVPG